MKTPGALAVLCACLVLTFAPAADAARRRQTSNEAIGQQTFASPQSNPIVVSTDGTRVYAANTTSGTVSILGTSPFQELAEVPVGVEPVGVALRPGDLELWVSNHVSDSVSVVDVNPASASYATVVETIQLIDAGGRTQFDEPVGIAFANASKAYVALSSSNRIAIVDANSYQVSGFLEIPAQDPRAIAARNGLLFVTVFESGNKTEASICEQILPGDPQCTLDLSDLVAFETEPNLPFATKNIVIDPDAPDRDLFIFDTSDDSLIDVVSGIGTLFYGIAIDSTGRAFMTETDGRNWVNGAEGDTLRDYDNYMFDSEIASVSCTIAGCGPVSMRFIEPGNGATLPANSMATPYGIVISPDDSIVIITSAGASRIATFASSNQSDTPLDRIDVGAIPKGLALHWPGGGAGTVYVLNTLDNSVSRVSVDLSGNLTLLGTTPIGSDPTPQNIRRGRIAFNSALVSDTGNFACASCHPDGNTDQLLWRLGEDCSGIGCGPGDQPRSTQPIRGLRRTVPLHWDGTLGDPFGGGDGTVGVAGTGGTSCVTGDADDEHDCFLDLVTAATAGGVMCDQALQQCPNLSSGDMDDMAHFLANVAFPPAPARSITDRVSHSGDPAQLAGVPVSALQGFSDFFMDQGGAGPGDSCADNLAGCHPPPLMASTNSTRGGFDAPTLRGLGDRVLQGSLGLTMAEEVLTAANAGNAPFLSPLEPAIQWDPSGVGYSELTVFGAAFATLEAGQNVRPLDIFAMLQEASTGHSGAFARQVTLNSSTVFDPATLALWDVLEDADNEGLVNLYGHGRRIGQDLVVTRRADGRYRGSGVSLTRNQLIAEVQTGTTLVTMTALARMNVGVDPQPLIGSWGAVRPGPTGNPPLALISAPDADPFPFLVEGLDVRDSARVIVDGVPQDDATLLCLDGSSGGSCAPGTVQVDLMSRPADGTHLLQFQNPAGPLSNELPFCVGPESGCLTD